MILHVAPPARSDRAGLASLVAALVAAAPSAGCGTARRAEPGSPPPAVHAGVVAHRGASVDAPENTLAAFTRAWSLGAESCELDVRVTADGHVVVIHDDTLTRTGGDDRAVADLTLAELQTIDVGSWHGPGFADQRVPTLAQVLDAMPAGRTLFVETKSGVDTAEAVAAAIVAADPRPRGGDVALQAYDPEVLAAVAARLPGVAAYWTVDPPVDPDRPDTRALLPYPPDLAADAAARGFAGLALDVRGCDDACRASVAAAGLLLDVWTVDDADGLATWRTRARWVETNRPDLAR